MKVYILSVIFCVDQIKKIPYLLTSSNDDQLLPILEIKYPQYFYKEIFHQLKNIFTVDSIKVESDCNYNFLEVQQEMSVQYAKEHYDFIKDDDLIITYGGILLKYECLEGFKWTEYIAKQQHNGYSSDMNLNLLLDNIIQRSSV